MIDVHYWRRQPKSFRVQYESYHKILKRCFDGESSGPGDSRYLELEDLAGPDLTILRGLRSTVCPFGDMSTIRYRVGVLGGSTVFCAEVPDHLTLPSQLALALEGCGIPAEVVNFGVSGATSKSAIERFHRYSDDGHFDLLVLYLGGNDCYAGLGKHVPASTITRTTVGKLIQIVTMLRELRTTTLRSVARLSSDAKRSGQSLMIVLQPLAATTPSFLRAIVGCLTAGTSWGLLFGLRLGYSSLRRHLRGLGTFLDLSSLPENADRSLFVDWAHLNATGNQQVAQRVAQAICLEMGHEVRWHIGSPVVQTTFHAPERTEPVGIGASEKMDPFNYPLF